MEDIWNLYNTLTSTWKALYSLQGHFTYYTSLVISVRVHSGKIRNMHEYANKIWRVRELSGLFSFILLTNDSIEFVTVPPWTHLILTDLRSKTGISLVSTWIGDSIDIATWLLVFSLRFLVWDEKNLRKTNKQTKPVIWNMQKPANFSC